MSFSRQFEKELEKLFYDATYKDIRKDICPRKGKPGKGPTLSKKKLDKIIAKLQDLASKALASKLAKEKFEAHVKAKHTWNIKGHGTDKKIQNCKDWYNANFDKNQGCIYLFRGKDGKPLYVGRTKKGGKGRPSKHLNKHNLCVNNPKKLTIYEVAPKNAPMLECLAIHYFQPKLNKNKASTKKWTPKCPLCKIHHRIEDNLRFMFRLK
jgi:hypothetical protein